MPESRGVVRKAQDVEWYAGKDAHTRPKRVKVNGVWENVFHYEKIIQEDIRGRRKIIFRCHIGDNRIVDIELE